MMLPPEADQRRALQGDALVACSALLYSAHVVRLGEFAGRRPFLARSKTTTQLVLVRDDRRALRQVVSTS